MNILVACCIFFVAVNAAEVDFRQRGQANQPSGRPISVPVIQHHAATNKRQADQTGGARPGSATTASFRQQAVPLQQPFRPSAGARPAPAAAVAPSRPDSAEVEEPRINPAFVEQKPQQAFVPFNKEGGHDAQPVRPHRSQGARPASRGNPEFERGFPEGFTNGLPSFDFQGRMPEPDEKSEGFMDGALNNFPSLKTFGGFDAMPDVAREDSSIQPSKRQQISSFQGSGRPSGSRSGGPQGQRSERRIRDTGGKELDERPKEKQLVIDDDEAMLEPDDPPAVNKTNKKRKTLKSEPTDIADIIAQVKEEEESLSSEADFTVAEQRYSPAFHPNNGPYGSPFIPPQHHSSGRGHQPPAAPTTVQPRRPFGHQPVGPPPSLPGSKHGGRSGPQRGPFFPSSNQYESNQYEDNTILGSGNFQVISGGIFSEPGIYKPFNNYFSPPDSNHLPQPQPHIGGPPSPPHHRPTPPSFQPFNHQFHPQSPFQPPTPSPVTTNPPFNPYPTSFFSGGVDEFFSNFRDFADVNQDYRN